MGTYYTYGATRADVIREVTAEYKLATTKVVGNIVWGIFTTEKGMKVIGCFKLVKAREGWGHKPMDESMGPYFFSCPLAFFDLAPLTAAHGKTAAEWREQVYRAHGATETMARDCVQRQLRGAGQEVLL